MEATKKESPDLKKHFTCGRNMLDESCQWQKDKKRGREAKVL